MEKVFKSLPVSLMMAACIILSFYAFGQSDPQLGKNSISEVVRAMTLDEKANLVVGNGNYMPGADLPGLMLKEPKGGQARIPGAAGSTYEIPRLGIPSIVASDGTAGLNIWYNNQGWIHYATAWPTATLLASTWDTATLKKVGAYFGREVKDYGVDIVLAPAINIQRDPLGGRNYEYFSEDPVITGNLSAALIDGLQSNGIGTSIKHFAANNQETHRNTVNTIVSERALREIYLRGFEIAIRKSKPWTVMTSYNLINGIYTSERKDLVTDILRNEWNFKGFVMTDWGGGKNPIEQMKAGNNLIMPGSPPQSKQIIDAVKNGSLSEDVLDKNVEGILNIVTRTHTFNKYNYSNNPDLEADALVAKEAAEEGIVLLKNDKKALPLNKQVHTVALFGNAGYDLVVGGKGAVNPPFKISINDGLARSGYTIEQNLKTQYTNYINDWTAKNPPKDLIKEYMNPTPALDELDVDEQTLAKSVDNSEIALISISQRTAEGADRKASEFNLANKQTDLINEVSTAFHRAGKKVIVVLNIAAPVDVMQWQDKADAILFVGEPGQEGGSAIAEILSGKVNPSGKLATTFPVKYEDQPSAKNFPGKEFPDKAVNSPFGKVVPAEVIYEEGIYVGYRYFNTFNVKPAYEFGYGLSYTNFSYSPVRLSASTFKNKITATVTITNTGKAAGKEIVELYLSAPHVTLDKPSEELKGFAKTALLQPGKSQTITFTLTAKDLASYNTDASSWIAEAGKYTVKIGASSIDVKSSASFNVSKEVIAEKDHKALTPQVSISEMNNK